MKKRSLAVLSTIMLTSIMLVGCANPFTMTTEKALDKMAKCVDSAGSVEMTLDFGTSIGTTIEGTNASIDINGNMDMDSVYDNKAKESTTAIDGKVGLSIMGMDVSQDMKSYIVNDGKDTTTYKYDPNEKSWSKIVEKQDTDEKLLSDLKNFNFAKDTEDLVLENSTYEDKDCYKISGVAKDIDLSEENTEELSELLKKGVELNKIDLDVEMYLDKKTCAPLSIKASTEDEFLSYTDDETSQTISIKGFEIEMKVEKLGGLKEVEIEKDALDAEEKSEDDSLSNGLLNGFSGDGSADDDLNGTDDWNSDDFNDGTNLDDTNNTDNNDSFNDTDTSSSSSDESFNAYNLTDIDETKEKVVYSDEDYYANDKKPISSKYMVADNGISVEVDNTESDTVEITAVVRFFDDDYKEVDYQVDNITALASGKTGYANVYAVTNTPCKYYSVSTYFEPTEDEDADLSTSDSKIDTEEGTLSCTVKNNSSKECKFIKVFIFGYKDGEPVWFNVGYTDVDALGAGETTTFSAYYPSEVTLDNVEFYAQAYIDND